MKQDADGVIKFATLLADGGRIESVIIPIRGRTTLCVSSQVGCARGCAFCATGAMGFRRNLLAEEIVGQVHAAQSRRGGRIDNVVFMGMGEPLDNLDAVVQAIRVMADPHGLDIAYRYITVSTAGHAEGIRKLGAFNLTNLRLAVSINAPDDALRSRLMPINRQYPLARLKEELLAFPRGKRGVIFVEYVLLAGVNDSADQARQLALFLDGLPVRVNVIPFNGGPESVFSAPAPEHVRRFCGWLAEEKLFVRERRSRGQEVMAACGMLGA
jgi:23S rRNA (adenine2503-C2)-methyltransferase